MTEGGSEATTGYSESLVRPIRTLWLLSAAHAVNHAQAALLPLVYLAVITDFGIGVAAIAFLAAAGNVLSGAVQLAYGAVTRFVSRRTILGLGGLVFGGGMAAQALAPGFAAFSLANVVSRVGGSPQHPVGNGLLAEQFPVHRRGFAISAHIAGGNVGTVAVPLIGAWLIAGIGWRWTVVLFGVPAILIALAMLALVRETGADRAAARAYGSLRQAYTAALRDRDLPLRPAPPARRPCRAARRVPRSVAAALLTQGERTAGAGARDPCGRFRGQCRFGWRAGAGRPRRCGAGDDHPRGYRQDRR